MTLKTSTFALTLSAAALTAVPALATNLVTNGDFAGAVNGQIGFNTSVTGWSTVPNSSGRNAYWFVFNPQGGTTSGTSADNSGAPSVYGTLQLWGPGTGVSSQVPVPLTLSPDGGAFVGSDPAFQNAALSQTINGLTIGKTYDVSFDWASAGQAFHGSPGVPTSAGWDVTLGSQTDTTGTISIPYQGFSGWQTANLAFTATSASETLSFLAIGTNSAALPPFALLDSVSISVPESSTWAMLLAGFVGLGYAGFRSQRRKPASIV